MLEFAMDREVQALRVLLGATAKHVAGTPARRKAVAEQAGCSADNLYQVARGVPLPSGRPRGLGRDVRERLDAAFPGWLEQEYATPDDAGAPPAMPAPNLRAALRVVLDALAAAPARAELRQLLPLLVDNPSAAPYRERLTELLDPVKADVARALDPTPSLFSTPGEPPTTPNAAREGSLDSIRQPHTG